MMPALVLLGYAGVMATLGAWALRQSSWPLRTPRLGVLAWQAASASVLLAATMAGLVLMLPTVPLSTDLSRVLKACVMAVEAMYSTPSGAMVGSAGAVAIVGVAGRTGYCLVSEFVQARRSRIRQRQLLSLLGRSDPHLGALVLDHDRVAAYCLPGGRGRVVVTSAAVASLPAGELRAVLAHEAAHLRARHDLVLAAARAVERAFPWVPLFRAARVEIDDLVEMLADDAAARRYDHLTVASALVVLAEMATPAGALAAGGQSAARRVERLVDGPRPLGIVRATIGGVVVAAVLAVPLGIALAPVLAASQLACCGAA
jgi:hypothetical protein